jgi:Tfp pilus assembly protein PilN
MSTTTQEVGTLWSAMPGWGISADLMPPEVLGERQIKVLRRRILFAVAVVALLCVLGYVYAAVQRHEASNRLADVEAQTSQLQAKQSKYANVTRIQGSVAEAKREIAGLMSQDVDLAALIDQLRVQLPTGMTIGQLEITMDSTKDSVAAAASAGTGAVDLDASGRRHIGIVKVAGTARTLSDVAAYLDRLKGLRGVVEPYPLTSKASGQGIQYSLQVVLTDELLTHKFDASKSGGN